MTARPANQTEGLTFTDTAMVTEQTLLEGSWYAIEQAGRLMQSAVTLFDAGDASTALAIAMFGREEIGRYELLRELAAEVKAGKQISVDDVNVRCNDHEEKQRGSAAGTVLRPGRGNKLYEALSALSDSNVDSATRHRARETIDVAVNARHKRYPQERHAARMKGLYVDLEPTRKAWSRPVTLDKEVVRAAITDAVNDYLSACQWLETEFTTRASPDEEPEIHKMIAARHEMITVRNAMNPKPVLLPPVFPKYPA